MYRFFFAFALVAGLLHSVSQAQDKKDGKDDFKKEVFPKDEQPPKKKTSTGGTTPIPAEERVPGDVEILFLNGSKVRVIIQTEKLEIASIYGRLTVPIEDVQAIEFGLHYPDGALEKVNLAIKNLGSSDYRSREAAAKSLVALGPFAYPAVVRTTSVKETEVAARAKDIVEKLKAKYPKKDLRTNVDDRVVTATQTLVGRILTTTVKTKAEYFGEIEHKLANMRTLRAFTSSPAEVDVTVDARKFANAGQWMETSYQADGKSTILITAKGQVDQWPQQPGQYICGPAGMGGGGRFGGQVNMMPGGKVVQFGGGGGMYGGVLIGKIGENGEAFIIGDRYDLKSESEGKLYLQIGPSPWNCASSGAYDVKISRKGD
jgi:hypothetical protein